MPPQVVQGASKRRLLNESKEEHLLVLDRLARPRTSVSSGKLLIREDPEISQRYGVAASCDTSCLRCDEPISDFWAQLFLLGFRPNAEDSDPRVGAGLLGVVGRAGLPQLQRGRLETGEVPEPEGEVAGWRPQLLRHDGVGGAWVCGLGSDGGSGFRWRVLGLGSDNVSLQTAASGSQTLARFESASPHLEPRLTDQTGARHASSDGRVDGGTTDELGLDSAKFGPSSTNICWPISTRTRPLAAKFEPRSAKFARMSTRFGQPMWPKSGKLWQASANCKPKSTKSGPNSEVDVAEFRDVDQIWADADQNSAWLDRARKVSLHGGGCLAPKTALKVLGIQGDSKGRGGCYLKGGCMVPALGVVSLPLGTPACALTAPCTPRRALRSCMGP